MKNWKKKALEVLKGDKPWAAWMEMPDAAYNTYVSPDWISDMPDEHRPFFLLLVIEAEGGLT